LKEGWSKDHDAIFALRLERMGWDPLKSHLTQVRKRKTQDECEFMWVSHKYEESMSMLYFIVFFSFPFKLSGT
jgi:hypothetical protein